MARKRTAGPFMRRKLLGATRSAIDKTNLRSTLADPTQPRQPPKSRALDACRSPGSVLPRLLDCTTTHPGIGIISVLRSIAQSRLHWSTRRTRIRTRISWHSRHPRAHGLQSRSPIEVSCGRRGCGRVGATARAQARLSVRSCRVVRLAMILCVTLNPCLDKTLTVPAWQPGDNVRAHRCPRGGRR